MTFEPSNALKLYSPPGMMFAGVCGHGCPWISENFPPDIASNPMSSLSGAHDEIDLPPSGAAAAQNAEADLLRKAQFGDRAAFGQIVLRFQDRLYNSILRMVGDPEEARDLTQETFTRRWSKSRAFVAKPGHIPGSSASQSTWRSANCARCRSIARSLSIRPEAMERRRALVTTIRLRRCSIASQSLAANRLRNRLRRERSEHVLAALGRLDAEYRAVLVMRDVEGFDYQQMAEVLGLPLGTLKSRLFRARLALRDELKTYVI